jgi:L-lactate dehydrogenase complex protein LldG
LTEEDARRLAEVLQADGLTTTSAVDDETLFSVDVAATGATMAVAETGTIVCQSGSQLARGASLIPPFHVAVVAVSQIVPDLCDCFARLAALEQLPANVNLITGPSKTADIEGVLVTGVHGPREVHIVLVAD